MNTHDIFDRRGACPALSAPMQTGDGLLVRLNPVYGELSASQLAGLCESAVRHGNGIVEITARGSFQVRGLTTASAVSFTNDVSALSIQPRTGLPIDVSPLAGIDPTEITDPRPLADAIRAGVEATGVATRLGPKVSVIVDGGGAIGMDEIMADVRVVAGRRRTGQLWRLAIGGDARTAEPMGATSETGAVAFVVDLLGQVAELGVKARARALLATAKPSKGAAPPVRRKKAAFALADARVGLCIGIPFGSVQGAALAALAEDARLLGISQVRLSPARMLIAICADALTAKKLAEQADERGFVINPNDPRLFIHACPGAPACSSGHFVTREVAQKLASLPQVAADAGLIHISGCPKGCAHPTAAPVTLVGSPEGVGIVVNATARDAPRALLSSDEIPARLPSFIGAAQERGTMEQR